MSTQEAKHDEPDAVTTRSGTRTWPWLLLLCVLAIALRLVAVHQFESSHPLADHPAIDEQSYDDWAREIAAGDWMGDEVFFQEPLYPYFLGSVYSLVGHDRHLVRVLQALLAGLTLCLLWSTTRKLFGDLAAWAAGLGFALYGPALLMPCLLLKPNLFLPILAAMSLILVQGSRRWQSWIGLGVLGGAGALLRGNMLILLPVLALLPFLRIKTQSLSPREALRSSGLFACGVALLLLPVMLRNWHVGEVFALTTSGAGTNVYGGNNGDNPYGVATEFDWVRGIPEYEAEDWRREAERRLGRELDAGQSSSYWLGECLASIKSNPTLHLSIFWNKFRLALGAYEVPDNHHLEWDSRYVGLLRLRWPSFVVVGGFGLAGLLLALFTRRLEGGRHELALLFLFYLATIVLTVMSMRARVPLVLLLLPFGGFWFAELSRLYSGRHERRAARAGLLLILGMLCASFVALPVFDEETLERDLADRDYNLVVSWLEREGELERASALARELGTRYPDTSRFQTLLATTEWRRGRQQIEEGEIEVGQHSIRTALERLRPIPESPGVSARERSRALRLAGYIQADIGNWEAAERFFGRAREFAGEDLELMVSHGQAILEAGRGAGTQAEAKTREAVELLSKVIEEDPRSFEASGARRLLGEFGLQPPGD